MRIAGCGGAPARGSYNVVAIFAPSLIGMVISAARTVDGGTAWAAGLPASAKVKRSRAAKRRSKKASVACSYNRRMDPRAVGVFDSGVGGLTVLHECLVTMPNEDFVYLGDHARLPYGPRPLDEVRRFAFEIAGYLETQGVKLIVVACNTATSAALPALQESLAVPVVGVITPEAAAAVRATRNRRIGLLATQATVAAGRYEVLARSLDAGVRFTAV